MFWTIKFSRKAAKQAKQLNQRACLALQLLIEDLQKQGPTPGKTWPNYRKLHTSHRVDQRHCHLTRGKPTYVYCWYVYKAEQLIGVYYVGTHEKAPY